MTGGLVPLIGLGLAGVSFLLGVWSGFELGYKEGSKKEPPVTHSR